ncbi:MAG: molybdopterin oxidoreductase [Oscillospiraceae bacterium]|nr:molybdopterin oxidoreductase [Oscillospiraceae bacterium]
MKDRDFLWCALNLMLDEEEELEQLCPACRSKAMENRCTVCGAPAASWEMAVNRGFDLDRFERMRRGMRE